MWEKEVHYWSRMLLWVGWLFSRRGCRRFILLSEASYGLGLEEFCCIISSHNDIHDIAIRPSTHDACHDP